MQYICILHLSKTCIITNINLFVQLYNATITFVSIFENVLFVVAIQLFILFKRHIYIRF